MIIVGLNLRRPGLKCLGILAGLAAGLSAQAEERLAYWSHLLPKNTYVNVGIPRSDVPVTDTLIADRLQHLERLGLGGIRVTGTSAMHAKLIEDAYALPNQVRSQYRVDQRWGSVPNDSYWAGDWGLSPKLAVDDFIWNYRLEDEIEYVAGLNEFYLEIRASYNRGSLPEYWRYPTDEGNGSRAIFLNASNITPENTELYWAHFVEDFTEATWNAMRPNDGSAKAAALAKVKVAGPAPAPPHVATQWKNVGDLTAWLDFGNMHPYGSEENADQMQGFRNAIKGGLDRPGVDYFGDLPVISSEFGSLTRSNDPSKDRFDDRATWDVQSKTLTRQLIQTVELQYPADLRQNFYDGINRVFAMNQFFSLYNAGRPYGIIDTDPLTPTQDPAVFKDAYFTLANVMNLFRDNEAEGFQPETLAYSVSGAPDSFRSILFQKSNGDFYIAYWVQESAWDQSTQTDPGGDNESPFSLTIDTAGAFDYLNLDPNVREFWDPSDPAGTSLTEDVDGAVALTATDRIQILRVRGVAWTAAALGDSQVTGAVVDIGGGKLEISGGGKGLERLNSSATFFYLPVEGDGEVVLRIDSFDAADPDARVGVMMRTGLENQATFAAASMTPEGKFKSVRRTTSGIDPQVNGRSPGFPQWVRVDRWADRLRCWYSTDGVNWTVLGNNVIADMGETTYAGFFVTSDAADLSVTAVAGDGTLDFPELQADLSDIALPGSDGVTPPFSLEQIGAAGVPGNVLTVNGNTIDFTGSGTGVETSSDGLSFVYVPVENEGAVLARIDSISGTDTDARAGVMIRTGLQDGATFASASMAPNGQFRSSRRTTAGTQPLLLGRNPGFPQWVLVDRWADRLRCFYSSDGVNWTVLGSNVIDDLGTTTYAGFFVSSGSATMEISARMTDGMVDFPNTQALLNEADGGSVGVSETVDRDYWLGVSGQDVGALTALASYPDSPDGADLLGGGLQGLGWSGSSAPGGVERYGNNYGQRIYGYIVPPTSDTYTFWLVSDDGSEFRLSSDADPANASLVASVPGWARLGQYDKYAEQRSAAVTLQAGASYYFEVLHKEGSGGDHVSVHWATGTNPTAPVEIVPASALDAFSQ